MNRITDWAPAVDPRGEDKDWGTSHLSDEVVKQPFLLYIDSRTDKENPRIGGCWFSLNLDGKINQPITPEEKEYIMTFISRAIDGLPGVEAPNE